MVAVNRINRLRVDDCIDRTNQQIGTYESWKRYYYGRFLVAPMRWMKANPGTSFDDFREWRDTLCKEVDARIRDLEKRVSRINRIGESLNVGQ